MLKYKGDDILKMVKNSNEIIEKAVHNTLRRYGSIMTGEIQQRLRSEEGKTGRFMEEYGRRQSNPGEVPAMRSGKLADSISYSLDNNDLEVGSPLNYSEFLEQGTSKMEARPVYKIVAQEKAVDLLNDLQRDIDKEIKNET